MRCDSRVKVASSPVATVMLVGLNNEDQDVLQGLCSSHARTPVSGCQWTFKATSTIETTLTALRRDQIPLVLCDSDRMPEAWKELLEQFADFSKPPCLIVTSRLADDYLWAEALNLGAYDVLARPFERTEVVRTFTLAVSHWRGGNDATGIPAA